MRSRTRHALVLLPLMTLVLAADAPRPAREAEDTRMGIADLVALPPIAASTIPLDEALRGRRSVRVFAPHAPSEEQVGQLCWAAQGITDPARGFRTAPSAGAIHPLEVYVVRSSGVFHYEPPGHRLRRVDGADRRRALASASLGQDAVRTAGVDFVITAAVSRTRAKYGIRAERYVHLEAGHAAQNILLEATALGLGAVPIGAFDDEGVRAAIGAPADEAPLYVVAVGRPGG